MSYAEGVSRTLERAGIPVWIDKESLKPGVDWYSKNQEALTNARVLVAIVSAASNSLQWTFFEIGYAMAAGTPVILVLLAEVASLPINLSKVQVVDAQGLDETSTAEVVAAAVKEILGRQNDS
jgi:nucleoside 2-deoxyribosyltransferase